MVSRAAVLEDSERQVLKQRAEEVEAAANLATKTILFGTLLCMVLITAAGFLLTRSLTQQIAAAVQHVQRSSSELQTAATQQAAGARESSTAMSEITTTITELLATSRQIAESAQRVAGVAEQTADAARLGDGTVQLAKDSITGIRQQVDMVVDHMLDLGRKSQQIGACWRSCLNWPSRPTSSPSTRPSKPPARARWASASAWWPTRSASSPIAWPARRRRSAA